MAKAGFKLRSAIPNSLLFPLTTFRVTLSANSIFELPQTVVSSDTAVEMSSHKKKKILAFFPFPNYYILKFRFELSLFNKEAITGSDTVIKKDAYKTMSQAGYKQVYITISDKLFME